MYKYNKAAGIIKQVASMPEPVLYLYHAIEQYELHLASLKEYPCHELCKEVWEDGKMVLFGLDFKLNEEEDYVGGSGHTAYPTFTTIAYPLKAEVDNTYAEAINFIHEQYLNDPFISDESVASILKQSFNITHKHK